MGIDASIYQNIKPFEMPSPMDSASRAMSLKHLATQTQAMSDDQAAKLRARKISTLGQEMEQMATMKPELRPEFHAMKQKEFLDAGIIQPNEVMPYSEENFAKGLAAWRSTPEFAALDKERAQSEHLRAQAYKDRMEAGAKKSKDLTPGQKTLDESFAKDLSEYDYGGGKATLEKNFGRLQGGIDKLKSNPNLTGGLSTRIPLLKSDTAQDSINPEMASVRDDIRGAIQGSLRQVLGPQFTEKEGEAIFNRAFNPALSGEENVRRATVEMEALRRMSANKDEARKYFLAKGTLQGFNPGGTNLDAGVEVASRKGIRSAQDQSGGLVDSAYASEKMPPPPKGMIRMRAPDGRVGLIPLSQKGEAIAAGGSVVK